MTKRVKVIIGLLFIIGGFCLMDTTTYTSIKEMVLSNGGNIGLAIAAAWSLIAVAFTSGFVLLKKAT